MEGEKKRCENCWVWIDKDLDVCPNCSHTLSEEAPSQPKNIGGSRSFFRSNTASFGFRYSVLFLLSFITVCVFLAVESQTWPVKSLSGFWANDLVSISVVAFVISTIFMFIDYMTSE
jgi:hypothetical protein